MWKLSVLSCKQYTKEMAVEAKEEIILCSTMLLKGGGVCTVVDGQELMTQVKNLCTALLSLL